MGKGALKNVSMTELRSLWSNAHEEYMTLWNRIFRM